MGQVSLDVIGMGDGPGVSESSQHPGRDPRRVMWMRRIAVLFVVVLLVVIVVAVVVPQVQKSRLRATIPQKAQAARTQALEKHNRTLGETRGPVASMLHAERPVHSVTTSMCWSDHGEGVIASTYFYSCQFVTLDFFEVPEGVEITPQAGPLGAPKYGLAYADQVAAATGAERQPQVPEVMYVTDGAASTDDVANEWLLTNGVPSYAAKEAFEGREVVDGEAASLDAGRRYLVVDHRDTYFNEEVGCAPGIPFYCAAPM